MNNINKNQQLKAGSFDDYDSIVGDYCPDENASEVSSINTHGVSIGMAAPFSATNSPSRGASARTNKTTPPRNIGVSNIINKWEKGIVNDEKASPSPLQFLPSHLVAVGNKYNNNNAGPSSGRPEESFNLDKNVDSSGYYHVGDYKVGDLGIDTTDVSAILGVASDDEESAVGQGPPPGTGTSSRQPTNTSIALNAATDAFSSFPTGGALKNQKYSSKVKEKQKKKQKGPLGDDLSYADENNENNPNVIHHMREYSEYDSEDEEDEDYDGILPKWIAFSSQRSKCVFVSSTALVLGTLVLAVVALGISYGTGNVLVTPENESNDISGVVTPPTDGGGANDDGTSTYTGKFGFNAVPTTSKPTLSPTTGDESGGGQGQPVPTTSSSPTPMPVVTGTPTADWSQWTTPITKTTSPVQPSPVSPVSLATTTSPASSSSAVPTSTKSPASTGAPISSNPTLSPSFSTQPTWGFGTDATEGGDITFYLMADGGSNYEFWSEKMRKLNVDDGQKFVVHLGSATRAVDNIPDCTETAYIRTQRSLGASPIPVYSIPGNNDYPECTNPTQGWENYDKHMKNLDTMYWNAAEDYDVRRQAIRDENFSFLYKRVLFIGLNMVTNSDVWETSARLEDNIDWVNDNIDAFSSNADIIFMMGNRRLEASENQPFYNAIIGMASSEEWSDKLFVYARRSSDTDIDYNIGGNANLVELRVGAEWPILDLRVRTEGEGAPQVEYRDVIEKEDEDDKDDEPKI